MGRERAGKGQTNGQAKGTNQRKKEYKEREEEEEHIIILGQEDENPWEPEGGWEG